MELIQVIALLRLGAAALETPGDLESEEIDHVVEDLVDAADKLEDVLNSRGNVLA